MVSRAKRLDFRGAREWEPDLFPWPLRPFARRLLWLVLVALCAALALVVTMGLGVESFR